MLEVQICKARRNFTIEASFTLPIGASLGLFGGSGEGKSTILSCIAGVDSPDRGRIAFQGEQLFPPPLPLHRRPIGYLTQKDHLFPHLTVEQNVVFSLERRAREAEREWIVELREQLGLAPVWRESARRLSGGQARRTALARMIARKPRLVLLDEPFSGLDRHVVRDLIRILGEWQGALGFTLVAVDHQANILEQMCPRALVIERGRIVQEGSWQALAGAPATPLLASLLAPG